MLSCKSLKGVGPRVAERLERLGIQTIEDLLFHLPFRYQDRTRIIAFNQLRSGEYIAVEGIIETAEIKTGRRSSLICHLRDATGKLIIRFFYFNAAQQRSLQPGSRIRCFGEVRWGPLGFEMIHPEYQLLTDDTVTKIEEYLTPIYPVTEGLHQITLRKLTDQALTLLENEKITLQEYLPDTILKQFSLPSLINALRYVHRPPPQAEQKLLEAGIHPAQQRLAFEELMAHQLSLQRVRLQTKQKNALPLNPINKLSQDFHKQLTFNLTAAQQRVVAELTQDLTQAAPMLRLVQGDVGSGKTVVAALAALLAIENNYQVALMAPTELLAEQHFNNFCVWLKPLGLKIAWLTGKLKNSLRQESLDLIKTGQAHLVVGTHALFQESVEFSNLALVIIDEQHRFGVQQRLALREKGIKSQYFPHQLIMTATPIPRTLAMTAYADLDVSIIDELPPGRTPVTTVAIPNQRRDEVIARVRENCAAGKQAYWVCTLIEESELLQCQAAEATVEQLKQVLPELKIALIHGQLKSAEKEKIMADFKSHQIDLLVATTVIEVGVDVANASLMIIENPERLGLAQLHQLRGRVGRGALQSHCVLLYQAPLSMQAKQRLTVMRETNDGFVIAQRDLELRGPGEVLGTRQTGLMQFKIADLLRDKNLLPTVQQAATLLMQNHSEYVELLIRRWLGTAERYGNV